jgi:hypothetical protein
MYGDAMRGKNSNIARKFRSKWWRVECDLINNDGVFIAKDWVVACDPLEEVAIGSNDSWWVPLERTFHNIKWIPYTRCSWCESSLCEGKKKSFCKKWSVVDFKGSIS